MRTIPLLGAAALATVLTFGAVAGATAASADDSSPSSTSNPSTSAAATPGGRLAKACARIPVRLEKVEKLQTKLHGDAKTRGSIAFLQARIDRATAEGQADRARLLTDRLAVRKDLDATLPDILTRLKDAQQVCDARSAGKTS
jgi:hypothetical protein